MGLLSRRDVLRAAAVSGVALAGAPFLAPRHAADDPLEPLPAASFVASSFTLGFSVNSDILWESASERARSFAFVAAIGATSVRLDIPWRWLEQRRGTFTWSLIDPVIAAAEAHGLSILAVLHTTPSWAALGGSTNQQTRPANLTQWANYVDKVARRYAGRISTYEIWNEPNGVEYFAPEPNPEAYAELVRAAVPKIRAADPQAAILAGALGPAPANDPAYIPAVEFFERMLAAGVGTVDGYSFHPYDNDQFMADATYWDNTAMRQMMRMHELLRQRGEGHKKIWATEYGAPSTLLGEYRQAELIAFGILQWRESSFAGPMYLHHHRDNSPNDGYGLATQSLDPKPAAYAVQSVAHQGFPTRWEATLFSQNRDSALGEPVSPVYSQGGGFAQEHANGSRYANGYAWLSATPRTAQVLRYAGLLPAAPATGGMQEVLLEGGGRVFEHEDGAFLVVGAILQEWTPQLGFPTSDQYVVDGSTVVQDFVHGTARWHPNRGTTIEYASP